MTKTRGNTAFSSFEHFFLGGLILAADHRNGQRCRLLGYT
jgi:hypothetical protein